MKSSEQNFFRVQGRRADFPTTHWSVVANAADSASPEAHEALNQLCRIYWPPVYAFVRRHGHGHDDALDLTQGFFAGFLEKKQVKLAKPCGP